MSGRGQRTFFPDRLPVVSDRWSKWLRPLWFLTFAFALLADVAGTAYVLHDTYESNPAFADIGLSSQIDDDGSVMLGAPVGAESRSQNIVEGSRILAIDGRPVAREALVDAVAARLRAAQGPVVHVRLSDPGGRISDHALTRSPVHAAQAQEGVAISRDVRMSIRFFFSALGCVTLLLCAIMLFARRPRDPVALIMSFAFLAMAATIDPPLLMWMSLGLGEIYEALSSGWWALLVVALAAFPDGRFTPRWLRWTPAAAVPIAVLLYLEPVNALFQLGLAVLIPLGLLLAQIARYRRLATGIERQQIKWAAFGFAAGLVLIGLAVLVVTLGPEEGVALRPVLNLAVVSLFSLGFALMPLGLMISLIRFRLWEADRVISRSAAYAIVTAIVGIVWAASSDLVKQFVASIMGGHNAPVATTMSAIIAAAVFAPTQSVVLGWTEKHFARDAERLKALAARLAVWRNTETAAEIGMRALAVVAESVHAVSAAILALTPTGRTLIAARDVEDPDALAAPGALDGEDPRFPLVLPLEDADGPVGTLLLGPRSDGNRYNKDERAALTAVTAPLAQAVRVARSRAEREGDIERKIISAVEERLAHIESSLAAPRPKPA